MPLVHVWTIFSYKGSLAAIIQKGICGNFFPLALISYFNRKNTYTNNLITAWCTATDIKFGTVASKCYIFLHSIWCTRIIISSFLLWSVTMAYIGVGCTPFYKSGIFVCHCEFLCCVTSKLVYNNHNIVSSEQGICFFLLCFSSCIPHSVPDHLVLRVDDGWYLLQVTHTSCYCFSFFFDY